MPSTNPVRRISLAHSDELLRAKLVPPRPQASMVVLERLFARFDQGLARPITLIAAPAGFGKSTLVGEWAATRGGTMARVSLDAGDNDPNETSKAN